MIIFSAFGFTKSHQSVAELDLLGIIALLPEHMLQSDRLSARSMHQFAWSPNESRRVAELQYLHPEKIIIVTYPSGTHESLNILLKPIAYLATTANPLLAKTADPFIAGRSHDIRLPSKSSPPLVLQTDMVAGKKRKCICGCEKSATAQTESNNLSGRTMPIAVKAFNAACGLSVLGLSTDWRHSVAARSALLSPKKVRQAKRKAGATAAAMQVDVGPSAVDRDLLPQFHAAGHRF
ncbi:hypothetical protein B0H13DRAFT_1854980 [Mycena leptocephala]|nr:hypothetical protein B0H13DRAFT_1854980 [Mycena leptocephala]